MHAEQLQWLLHQRVSLVVPVVNAVRHPQRANHSLAFLLASIVFIICSRQVKNHRLLGQQLLLLVSNNVFIVFSQRIKFFELLLNFSRLLFERKGRIFAHFADLIDCCFDGYDTLATDIVVFSLLVVL
jgi:hypothetical protein